MSEPIGRRVVCAAIRVMSRGLVITGSRHFDTIMRGQMSASDPEERIIWGLAEQGFIDQRGEFLTREEAHQVATAAGQIIRRCGGDEGRLYSENLY